MLNMCYLQLESSIMKIPVRNITSKYPGWMQALTNLNPSFLVVVLTSVEEFLHCPFFPHSLSPPFMHSAPHVQHSFLSSDIYMLTAHEVWHCYKWQSLWAENSPGSHTLSNMHFSLAVYRKCNNIKWKQIYEAPSKKAQCSSSLLCECWKC